MNKLFLILFISVIQLTAQNLKKVDAVVLEYNTFKSINDLSNQIKNDFHSEKEKVRAVYTWIANNIRYDKYHLAIPNRFFYTSQKDYQEQLKKDIKKVANETFNFKKGVCYGYASLFIEICTNLSIKSEIINGYAKSKVTVSNVSEINSLTNNHSWNKVFIDSKPYLIDVTWSINIIPNKNGYIKDINYDFFLTNPYLFILDHYPENFKDSLIDEDISELSFINYPKIYLKGYDGIRLIRPIKSEIYRNNKTNTKFALRVMKPIKEVAIFLGNKFYYNIPYSYSDNVLTFNLNLENKTGSNLTLFINNKAICSYWVK